MPIGVYKRSPEQIKRLRKQSGPASEKAATKHRRSPEERIEKYTVKTEGCWNWIGYKADGRYGYLYIEGKYWRVTRWVWTQAHGPIPEGLYVLHHCDNTSCIRLDHLYLGTPKQNAIDASKRGLLKGNGRPKGPHKRPCNCAVHRDEK